MVHIHSVALDGTRVRNKSDLVKLITNVFCGDSVLLKLFLNVIQKATRYVCIRIKSV
jgi:hypothetical protein